jgi:hypothetical protein
VKVRLHHLRSTLVSTLHIQGVICAPILVGLGALVQAAGGRHHERFLSLPVTFALAAILAFIAAVAMSTSQHTVSWRADLASGRTSVRLPHPTLPLSPRWRAALSAIAWLPAWLLGVGAWAAVQGACAVYADGSNFASDLVAGPSASELLPGGLLILPTLVVFGFDQRVAQLRFLSSVVPVAAVLTAASALGAMDSLGRLVVTSAILLILALTAGEKIAAHSLRDRPASAGGRVQPLRLPPLAPAAALRRQVVGGIALSLRRALPWSATPTALCVAAFHWMYVAYPPEAGPRMPETHFIAPIVGVGVALWVSAAMLFPVGTRLSAVTAEDIVVGWRGPWARQWELLPVSRRQLFHATYWPMLAVAVLTLFCAVGWHFLVPTYWLSVHNHPWVLPFGLAYGGAFTALNCAGLLGHRRVFRASLVLAAVSLTLLCFGVLLDATALLSLSGAFSAVLAVVVPPWLFVTSNRPLLDGG